VHARAGNLRRDALQKLATEHGTGSRLVVRPLSRAAWIAPGRRHRMMAVLVGAAATAPPGTSAAEAASPWVRQGSVKNAAGSVKAS
jgi:hypothetical protein